VVLDLCASLGQYNQQKDAFTEGLLLEQRLAQISLGTIWWICAVCQLGLNGSHGVRLFLDAPAVS
jgi:hypothetical protein